MADHKGFFKGEKKKQKKLGKEKSFHFSDSPSYQMPEIITKKKSSDQ